MPQIVTHRSLDLHSVASATTSDGASTSEGHVRSIQPDFRLSAYLHNRGHKGSAKGQVSFWYCLRDVFTFSHFSFHHEKVSRRGDLNGQLRTHLLSEFTNVALVAALILSCAVGFYLHNTSVRKLYGTHGNHSSAVTTNYFISMTLVFTVMLFMVFCIFISTLCMSIVGLMAEEEIPSLVYHAGFVLKVPSALMLYSIILIAFGAVHTMPFFVNTEFCVAGISVIVVALIIFLFAAAHLIRASYLAANLEPADQRKAVEAIESTCEQQGEGVAQRDNETAEDRQSSPQVELTPPRCKLIDDVPSCVILDCIFSSEWLPMPPNVRLNGCSCGENLQVADSSVCARCGEVVCSSCAERHREACASRLLRVVGRSTCRCPSMSRRMQESLERMSSEAPRKLSDDAPLPPVVCSSNMKMKL